jgi:NAD(P)-dependent dehydrogenase (short-subunit alcohol dehydrogenase family)
METIDQQPRHVDIAAPGLIEAKRHDVYPFIDPNSNLTGAAAGRNVLVIGAGSGIGKAIALAFAETGASHVVITGRREKNLEDVKASIEQAYPQTYVHAIAADASKTSSVDELFAKIKDAGIELDVLVNSQGQRTCRSRIIDADPDAWWDDYESMVKSPFLTTRAFLRSLKKPDTRPSTPTRAVINVGSAAAYWRLPLQTAYAPVKAALARLTEYTALENPELGVQAIAYHPGGVANTDLTKGAAPWMMQYYTETPELAAMVAVYLSTPRAEYLNGRQIDATWDLEELEGLKDRIVKDDLFKMSLLGADRPVIPDWMRAPHEGRKA